VQMPQALRVKTPIPKKSTQTMFMKLSIV